MVLVVMVEIEHIKIEIELDFHLLPPYPASILRASSPCAACPAAAPRTRKYIESGSTDVGAASSRSRHRARAELWEEIEPEWIYLSAAGERCLIERSPGRRIAARAPASICIRPVRLTRLPESDYSRN
jgi:hypothetical protein